MYIHLPEESFDLDVQNALNNLISLPKTSLGYRKSAICYHPSIKLIKFTSHRSVLSYEHVL